MDLDRKPDPDAIWSAAGDMMSVEDVTDILSESQSSARVPDDEEIVISTNQGEPLVGMNSFAGQAYLKYL